MKRSMTATLAGEEIELVATFKAASDIAEKVGDPLMITREIALCSMLEAKGVQYEPKWKYTVGNIPLILHAGMKAAGDKRGLSEVQDLVFGQGFYAARDVATNFLSLIVAPSAEEPMTGDPAEGE